MQQALLFHLYIPWEYMMDTHPRPRQKQQSRYSFVLRRIWWTAHQKVSMVAAQCDSVMGSLFFLGGILTRAYRFCESGAINARVETILTIPNKELLHCDNVHD